MSYQNHLNESENLCVLSIPREFSCALTHGIALTWDLSSPIRYEEFTVSGALQEREEIILLKNPNLYNQIKQAGLNERQCVSELL